MATQLTGPVMPIKTVSLHLKLQLLPSVTVCVSDQPHLSHVCNSIPEPVHSSRMMTNLRNLCNFFDESVEPFLLMTAFMGFCGD